MKKKILIHCLFHRLNKEVVAPQVEINRENAVVVTSNVNFDVFNKTVHYYTIVNIRMLYS